MDAVGQPFDLSEALSWRQLGVLGVPQHAYHRAQLGERSGRRLFDGGQGLDGSLRVGCRDGTSRLGLDDNAGDVVGDRVMELTRELFALTGFGLLDVADADPRAEADRGALTTFSLGYAYEANRKNAYPATVSATLVDSATKVMDSQSRIRPRPPAASRPEPHRNRE